MYEDAGISGAKVDEDDMSIDRPGIQDMLADISEEIGVLVETEKFPTIRSAQCNKKVVTELIST